MRKYIKFSSFNKNYIYILLCCFFQLLRNTLFKNKFNNNFDAFILLDIERKNEHEIVHDFYCYLTIFLISVIIFFLNKVDNSKKKANINLNQNSSSRTSSGGITLIYNDLEEQFKYNNSVLSIFAVNSLFILSKILTTLFNKFGFKDLSIWMFELFIISFLYNKLFKKSLFKHQKLAIYFNVIIISILKLYFLLKNFLGNKDNNNKIYITYEWIIPIGFIFYLIIMLCRSYSITRLKYFMDIRYISQDKLLISFGLIGTFFYAIILVISTFAKCDNHLSDINFCNIKNNTDSNNNTYLDSINIYYQKYKEKEILEFLFQIFLTFLGVISNYLYIYFYISVIKYLSPIHVIFFNSVYYFIIYTALLICYFFNIEINIKNNNPIIPFICNFLAIIGFMIYLEIIELDFCGFNYNLTKYIISRSKTETEKTNEKSLINNEDEDSNNEISLSNNELSNYTNSRESEVSINETTL